MFNQDAKKNMYSGILYQACTLIVGFVLRKYIVDYLGVYNLGVNGVFENAMAMLSLLDFGLGSACMFYLYKAFAKDNKEQIASIYSIFKRAYFLVSLGMLVIGLIVIFNIQLIIDIENNRGFLQAVFGIFLLKQVLNHLLICPRTFLQCDGKRYIGTIADTVCLIVFAFLKIYFLEKTSSLIIYLILLTIEMLVATGYVYFRFKREYKDIDFKNAKEDVELRNGIVQYSKSLAISNINFFIYSSTDNIVLSKFCGTIAVGYMSNYYMIVNAIKGFLTQISNAIEANMIKNYNTDDINKVDQYNLSMFFCYCISAFSAICLNNLTNSFVFLYFGEEFVMDKNIILLMSIIIIITFFKKPSSTVVVSKKMVNKEIPFTITMMITNIGLSIMLSYKLGPVGVLLGTIISELILFFGDEILAFKSDLGLKREIIFKKIVYAIVVLAEYIVSSLLMISVNNYFDWCVNLAISTLVFFCFTMLFNKTKEFKDLFGYLFKIKIK